MSVGTNDGGVVELAIPTGGGLGSIPTEIGSVQADDPEAFPVPS